MKLMAEFQILKNFKGKADLFQFQITMGAEICMSHTFFFLYEMVSGVGPDNYPTMSCCVPFWRGR